MGEQRPDPCWYKAQYGMVSDRVPACDFVERTPHVPRRKPADVESQSPCRVRTKGDAGSLVASPVHGHPSTFLTGIDAGVAAEVDAESQAASRAAQPLLEKPQKLGQMGLATARPDLGKVGRVHVLMHEVSHPAEDLLQQDVKGFAKLRYPHWDISSTAGHGATSSATNDVAPPGKYDVRWGAVRSEPKSGIPFHRAMTRSVSVTT